MNELVFHISTMSALMEVLSLCVGGAIVLLAAGAYGALDLSAPQSECVGREREFVIASAGPERAVFSALSLTGVANLTFRDIVFDYEHPPGGALSEAPFRLRGARDVAFVDCLFDGALATGLGDVHDGYGAGVGLSVLDSRGVRVIGGVFRDFHRGLAIGRSEDIRIAGGVFTGMSSDGMNFAQVRGVTIEGNRLSEFRKHPDGEAHMDMIQFWTNGSDAPSSNIVIRDNFLNRGSGSPTQSIFMRNDLFDRGLAAAEMRYADVLIENNVIYNSHTHGVTVGAADRLTVRRNTMLMSAHRGLAADVNKPTIMVADASTRVEVSGNVVAKPIAVDAGSADDRWLPPR